MGRVSEINLDRQQIAQPRDALVKALEDIQQRANEHGTGEMALIDTIHAMHKIARDALTSATTAA